MIALIVRLALTVVTCQLIALVLNSDDVSQGGVFVASVIGWAVVECAFVVIRRRKRK